MKRKTLIWQVINLAIFVAIGFLFFNKPAEGEERIRYRIRFLNPNPYFLQVELRKDGEDGSYFFTLATFKPIVYKGYLLNKPSIKELSAFDVGLSTGSYYTIITVYGETMKEALDTYFYEFEVVDTIALIEVGLDLKKCIKIAEPIANPLEELEDEF